MEITCLNLTGPDYFLPSRFFVSLPLLLNCHSLLFEGNPGAGLYSHQPPGERQRGGNTLWTGHQAVTGPHTMLHL